MKTSRLLLIAVALVLLAALAGYFIGRRGGTTDGAKPTASTTADTGTRKILYWKAPMNPDFHSDKPGKSPMGMDLVPVYANGGSESSDVKIDPAVVNNLGVRTAEVQQDSLSDRIEAVGYVGYDEDTVASINTRADGWIEKLAVKSVGDTVRAGQLLYELFSPKLATAEREYLTALASGSQSLISASHERMRALGFTAAQVKQLTHARKVSNRVARRADSGGVVVALNVREGAYVQPATQVMKLADLSTVWVLVEVDESQASLLRTGQKAMASFDAFPDRQWSGTVDYIYPNVNPVTRTLKARLRFANPNGRLKPNMYAHVAILAAPRKDAVSIPVQALIRTGHSQRVVVAHGDGRFDICPVKAGISSGNRVEILKGLQPGQRVVVSSQFLIDSEANIDAAALRIGAGKPGCSAAKNKSGSAMPDMPMPSNPAGDQAKEPRS
jgi:Cu(I)/Ag(I) efflux system membrane fusion protein